MSCCNQSFEYGRRFKNRVCVYICPHHFNLQDMGIQVTQYMLEDFQFLSVASLSRDCQLGATWAKYLTQKRRLMNTWLDLLQRFVQIPNVGFFVCTVNLAKLFHVYWQVGVPSFWSPLHSQGSHAYVTPKSKSLIFPSRWFSIFSAACLLRLWISFLLSSVARFVKTVA